MSADGGPAFPADIYAPNPGMSLRDYFAAEALGHFISNSDIFANLDEKNPGGELAEAAYQIADAMLAERAK